MAIGRCPFCLWPIGDDETPITCVHCNVSYHDDCYAANGACATFGCPGWAQRPYGGASIEDHPVAATTQPLGRIVIEPDESLEPAAVAENVMTDPGLASSIEAQPAMPELAIPTEPVTLGRVAAFCDQCGTPVAPSDRFCAGCGHALGAM